MLAPFATTSDVEARWRTLSSDERDLAETALADASDMIRVRWPDVDARIASGGLSEGSVTRVVATMVKRAMDRPASLEGFESFNQAAGPFSAGGKVSNPNGNLFLNAEEVNLFDGYYSAPRSRMGWLA